MERETSPQNVINNQFYDELQEGWYSDENHPVALLRAENRVRNPWIAKEIKRYFQVGAKVLDIGCGAGLLTNALAKEEHQVCGIDLSATSLEVAKKHDSTKTVQYEQANAYNLPFENESFDVVCAMDVLEHVEQPKKLIYQAGRVLKPGGLFFFHTFNRNWLSYLVIIKGVEWFVKNTPHHMHVYELFITPKELQVMCELNAIVIQELSGFHPAVLSCGFWKMLWSRKVPPDFRFEFSKCTPTGYCGFGLKL